MLERKRKLDCANGREKADLVLKNGNVLNVFTEEVLKADVAICGDTIVGVGEYEGKEEIDWYREISGAGLYRCAYAY